MLGEEGVAGAMVVYGPVAGVEFFEGDDGAVGQSRGHAIHVQTMQTGLDSRGFSNVAIGEAGSSVRGNVSASVDKVLPVGQ